MGATTRSGRAPKRLTEEDQKMSLTFPNPVLLPGDKLALDSRYPPQRLRTWINNPVRNQPDAQRNKFYIVEPEIHPNAGFMKGWLRPTIASQGAPRKKKQKTSNTGQEANSLPLSHVDQVEKYLAAFYDGLPIVRLYHPAMEEESPGNSSPDSVGFIADKCRQNQPPDMQCNFPRDSHPGMPQQKGIKAAPFRRSAGSAHSCAPDDVCAALLLIHVDVYDEGEGGR